MFHSLSSAFRILAIITAAMAALFLTSCSDSPEVYTVETMLTSNGDVIRRPKVTTVDALHRAANAAGPKATVRSAVHDFGQMDPLTTATHAFVIENTGDSVLELREGPTTCKCTLGRLDRTMLPPGERARAVVTWNSGRDHVYRHSATVFTNDPRNKAIALTIKGRVRVLLGCEPKQLVFSRVAPGDTPSATAIVYSQNWNAMKLTSVHASLAGLNWRVAPASAEQIGSLRAKSGYRITISPPKDLPAGYFMSSVWLEAEPAGVQEGESAKCELVVSGKILRRLAVFGSAIDSTGTVHLGRVPRGKGASVRLLMKVRDDQKTLTVREIECAPAFLKVRVEPHKNNGAKIGLYELVIDVPKDAPTFRLLGNETGRIQLTFDHPRVLQLELKVDLIVTPRQPSTRFGGA